METPSFDFSTPDDNLGSTVAPNRYTTGIRLVPQATFLSWPREMQLSYCAARDEHSALVESDFAEFYLERAVYYRSKI